MVQLEKRVQLKVKTGKFATSDWMKVEQERGISVTSSVMQFDYDDYKINILDTRDTKISQKILTVL